MDEEQNGTSQYQTDFLFELALVSNPRGIDQGHKEIISLPVSIARCGTKRLCRLTHYMSLVNS